jgi:hypothetical protein
VQYSKSPLRAQPNAPLAKPLIAQPNAQTLPEPLCAKPSAPAPKPNRVHPSTQIIPNQPKATSARSAPTILRARSPSTMMCVRESPKLPTAANSPMSSAASSTSLPFTKRTQSLSEYFNFHHVTTVKPDLHHIQNNSNKNSLMLPTVARRPSSVQVLFDFTSSRTGLSIINVPTRSPTIVRTSVSTRASFNNCSNVTNTSELCKLLHTNSSTEIFGTFMQLITALKWYASSHQLQSCSKSIAKSIYCGFNSDERHLVIGEIIPNIILILV